MEPPSCLQSVAELKAASYQGGTSRKDADQNARNKEAH